MIEAANDSANVTDTWILQQFSEDVVQTYMDRYENNFMADPDRLLTILKNTGAIGGDWEGYSVSFNDIGGILQLTRSGSDTYEFRFGQNSDTGEPDYTTVFGEFGDKTYVVEYNNLENVTEQEH